MWGHDRLAISDGNVTHENWTLGATFIEKKQTKKTIKTTDEFTENIKRLGIVLLLGSESAERWREAPESVIHRCRILFRCRKPWRKRRGGMGQANDPVSQSQSPGNWTSAAATLWKDRGPWAACDLAEERLKTAHTHTHGWEDTYLCRHDFSGSKWRRNQPEASPPQTPARVQSCKGNLKVSHQTTRYITEYPNHPVTGTLQRWGQCDATRWPSSRFMASLHFI